MRSVARKLTNMTNDMCIMLTHYSLYLTVLNYKVQRVIRETD